MELCTTKAEEKRGARPSGYLVQASGESWVYKDQKLRHEMGWRDDPPAPPRAEFLALKTYGGTLDSQAAHAFRTQVGAHDRAREVRRYFGAWASPTYHMIPFWREPGGQRRLGHPVEMKV